MQCPKCGFINRQQAQFCEGCGNRMMGEAPAGPVKFVPLNYPGSVAPPAPQFPPQTPQYPPPVQQYPQQMQQYAQPQYAQPVPQYAQPMQQYPQQASYDPRMRMPGQMAPDPTDRRYADNKSPGLALFLSFLFLGVGQIYNGDWKKCFAMWGVFILVLILTAFSGGVLGFLGFGPWIWSMIDAYNVASRKSPIW